MVIDTKKHFLKHNQKEMELNIKEQKLISFLSDNEPHKIGEIRKICRIFNRFADKVINKKLKQESKTNT